MSKKKKRCRRTPPLTTKDRHHICWVHAKWSKGYAKLICNAFVRSIPIVYHRELHQLIKEVPLPDEKLLKQAWLEYQKNAEAIDSMEVCQAIAWLYVHIPDTEFRKAMQYQLDFFATRMGQR